MKRKKHVKRPYAELLHTNPKEYHRLSSQEYRERYPEKFPVKDEWRKLDKNTFDELPDDVILVEDFPTYYARPNGEVWRDTRGTASAIKIGKERVLRLTPTFNAHNNYWLVQPYKDGKKKAIHLHRFILIAFQGLSPIVGMECHHIDHDTSNNSIDNLMWVTRQQNHDFVPNYKRRGPRKTLGEGRKIPNSLWSPYFQQIIELYMAGLRGSEIALKLDIPSPAIYQIIIALKKRGEL